MKTLFKTLVPSLALLAASSAFAEPVRVLVSIENLAPSRGTSQTPHWVGFHDGSRFDTYNGNTPASSLPVPGGVSIERLAEDGNTGPLSDDFQSVIPEGVDGVIAGPNGPIGPGETAAAAFLVDSTDVNNRYFSYASMVLPSNDFWYSNGNPQTHPIFDASGNFVARDFIVTQDDILDAGTEVNSEIPGDTAFFGQTQPNTGADENGVILDFDPNDPLTFFQRPGNGGILDDARFAMGDFLTDGYPVVKISFSSAPVISANENYISTLTGDNEVPAVSTRNVGRAAYRLRRQGTTLRYDHSTTIDERDIQMAHLHLGAEGVNGPVVAIVFQRTSPEGRRRVGRFFLPSRRGSRIIGEINNGDLVGPLAGQPLDALIAEINAGNIYVNIHTRDVPSGELRGQLNVR